MFDKNYVQIVMIATHFQVYITKVFYKLFLKVYFTSRIFGFGKLFLNYK